MWRLAGGVEVRKDVNIFGATKRGQSTGGAIPTRFEGDPQALIFRANALVEGPAALRPRIALCRDRLGRRARAMGEQPACSRSTNSPSAT